MKSGKACENVSIRTITTYIYLMMVGEKKKGRGGNAHALAESPSVHMSVLMVAQVSRLVVDEALEWRRAAAGSVFHCLIIIKGR